MSIEPPKPESTGATRRPSVRPGGIIGKLLDEGYRFNFFQAVRLLESWKPTRAAVGRDANPRQEAARFGALASNDFPASQIYDVKASDKDDRPPDMTVTFFGLTGPQGALPRHYTELLLERLAKKDRTLRDFLDLFNHRLMSLFYRAWEKYQFWISSERTIRRERQATAAGPEHLRGFVLDERAQLDPLGEVLLALTGLAGPASRYVLPERDHLEPRTGISDQTWRYYSGLLAQRRRPAVSLENLLADHFRWPVRVQSLCGRWLLLEPSDRTRLAPGGNTRLGVETVAGQKVWEVQGKFRISLGPLKYAEFCSLLPVGDGHRPLVQLTRLFAGTQLDFDLQLNLRPDEIPKLKCGDRAGIGPRLGWNTWLKSQSAPREPVAVGLRPYDTVGMD
jgi:type VI secretion system protein ImpH